MTWHAWLSGGSPSAWFSLSDQVSRDILPTSAAVVLLVLVGRQALKVWSGWSDLSRAVTDRGEANEERADELQRQLTEEVARRAALETQVEYMQREIDRLTLLVQRLQADQPPQE